MHPSAKRATGVAAVAVAAWVVYSLLARTPRSARWWPFVGSAGIAISMLGPSYLADGAAAVVLIAMHLAVGAILIKGLFTAPVRSAPGQHTR